MSSPSERLDEDADPLLRRDQHRRAGRRAGAADPHRPRPRRAARPVVLLNGQRIAGFGEIRELPPEAIERVDILPEETALNYGYRADQRVINIVLKENFRAVTVAGSLRLRDRGRADQLRGQRQHPAHQPRPRAGRSTCRYQRSGALLESERDIIQSAPVDAVRPRPAMSAPRPSIPAPRSIRR